MPQRNYQRLSVEKFGKHLLESGDLDPVYIALYNLDWKKPQLYRWLVAYWCLYHCGAASYLSTYKKHDFWELLLKAAVNEDETCPVGGRWPRGHERRHFRGKAGIESVTELHRRYGDRPEEMVKYISDGLTARRYEDIANAVQEHKLFGPWISFKIADMIDRVLGIPVDFTQGQIFMFNDPVKGALLVYEAKQDILSKRNLTANQIKQAVRYMKKTFGSYKAPPRYERPLGIQEFETIFCKWKSHLNGSYPLFNDIDEIHEGLKGWGEAADEFASVIPKEPTRRPSDEGKLI